jgi:hypothetical protein
MAFSLRGGNIHAQHAQIHSLEADSSYARLQFEQRYTLHEAARLPAFYIGSIKMWDEDEFTKWVMSRKCAR